MTSQPESPHEMQALERILAPFGNEVIEEGRMKIPESLKSLNTFFSIILSCTGLRQRCPLHVGETG